MPLIFAPESGEAIVGSERVIFAPVGNDGSVQLCDRSRAVVRPLRFGERTRLLIDALQSDDPPPLCSDLLVHAATNISPDVLTPAEKVLALLLAGGDIEAPALSRTVAVVADYTGWPPELINSKTAVEIDRMACNLISRNSEWKKIVFPRQGAENGEAIIDELTTGLLKRVDEIIIKSATEVFSPAAVSDPINRAKRENREPLFRQARVFPIPTADSDREPAAYPAKSFLAPSSDSPGFEAHQFREFKNAPDRNGGEARATARHPGDSGNTSFILGTVTRRSDSHQQNEAFPGDRYPGTYEKKGKGEGNPQKRDEGVSPLTNENPPKEGMKYLIQRLQLFPHPPVKRTSSGHGILKSGSGYEPELEGTTTGGFGGKPASGFRKWEFVRKKETDNPPKATIAEAESWTDIPPISPGLRNRTDPGREDFPLPIAVEQKPPLSGNTFRRDSNPGQRTEGPPQPNRASKPQAAADGIFPLSYTIIPAEDTNRKERKKEGKEDVASALEALDLADLADGIGRLLADEADLRGID